MVKVGKVYLVSVQSSVGGVRGRRCQMRLKCKWKDLKTTDYNVKVKHKAKCECVGNKQSL